MHTEFIDRPMEVREEERLDADRIEQFLKDTVPGLTGPLRIRQYPGGHSNLTYWLQMGDREMVLRRPPFGTKAKTAHDMGREYRVLKALQSFYPYCPRPLVHTDDESVIGSPFYVMEKISGIILRKDMPAELDLSPGQVREMFENLIRVHYELHSVDWRAAGLEDFGKPEGYMKRQVLGWNKRYRNARTPDAPIGEEVMAWLEANLPPDSGRAAVIHNDFRLDNAVLDPEDPIKIIGVLDWEMATIGDPLMDLGCSLPYFVQADDPPETHAMRQAPTNAPGAPTRREVVQIYERLSGRKVDHIEFYYTFGLFRLAVIAQQIYYRYYHGQTSDQRFKLMGFGATVLERTARRVIAGQGL